MTHVPGAGRAFRSRASATSIACATTLTYSAKATWQLANAHRIDASFFGDPSRGDNGPQRTSALLVNDTASFSSLTYGGHNQTDPIQRRARPTTGCSKAPSRAR